MPLGDLISEKLTACFYRSPARWASGIFPDFDRNVNILSRIYEEILTF
jgi:hypothetical protein